jgi:hypothetical protein
MKSLIAIVSCHGHRDQRIAQRETWLHRIGTVEYRFFLGRPGSREDGPTPNLVVLDSNDAYSHLSEKVASLCRWALAWGYEYVFKCDDDTYVCPDRLLASGFNLHDYSGFIEDRDCHLRAFNFPVYPHAAGGPGYWLSRRAMKIIGAELPPNSPEDFAVGKVLALHRVKASHDWRYVHDDRKHRDDVVRSQFISLHKCDPAEMRRVHAERKSFCLEQAELTTIPTRS